MRAHIFFSVHERLFDRMARELAERHGVERFGGFVWGEDQRLFLEQGGVGYRPLSVFTRDILPEVRRAPPDRAYLEAMERRCGVSIHRMIFAERHLLAGRDHDEVLRLAELLLRHVEGVYESARPDFVFSEDVSCLASYVHWALARAMEIPFWAIGNARLGRRVMVYRDLQQWEGTVERYREIQRRGLDPREREEAAELVEGFRSRPERPPGMTTRSRLPVASRNDVDRVLMLSRRYRQDPANPVLENPLGALVRRARRLLRARRAAGLFSRPGEGERYVLYPIHFQPEASTLVLAPYYLDQLTLVANIAKSLPVGYRLYVKEHVSNRGRRPLSFYRALKKVPGVRLLGPDEDVWRLIRNAGAVAVITGTMGWEGLLLGKPVVTFGRVFFNRSGLVYEAGKAALDDWYGLFRRALFEHVHDDERLLAFVAAILRTSHPGFMHNPVVFPEVLESDNVARLSDALAAEAGLAAARTAPSTVAT